MTGKLLFLGVNFYGEPTGSRSLDLLTSFQIHGQDPQNQTPSRGFCQILFLKIVHSMNLPISHQHPISIPFINVRKPKLSELFRGYRNEKLEWNRFILSLKLILSLVDRIKITNIISHMFYVE